MVNHYYVVSQVNNYFTVDVDVTELTFQSLSDFNEELLFEAGGEQLQVIS